MNEFQKHNAQQKYMFYYSFYIRLKEGKSLSRVIEATQWLSLVGEGVTGRPMRGMCGAGIVLWFYLKHHLGVTQVRALKFIML